MRDDSVVSRCEVLFIYFTLNEDERGELKVKCTQYVTSGISTQCTKEKQLCFQLVRRKTRLALVKNRDVTVFGSQVSRNAYLSNGYSIKRRSSHE